MAIPGYHDPAYDPIMATGEATPLDEPWQAAFARKLAALRTFLNKVDGRHPLAAVAEKATLAATGLKDLPDGTVGGLMSPDARPEGSGLGEALVGEAPQSFEKWGRGDAPYTTGEAGLAGRLPMLKPGRAQQAVDIGQFMPLDLAASAGVKGTPLAVGAVRRSVDKLSPDTAKALANNLLESVSATWREEALREVRGRSGTLTEERAAKNLAQEYADAVRDSLAKYITEWMGKKGEPFEKLPSMVPMKEVIDTSQSSFYQGSSLPTPFRKSTPFEAGYTGDTYAAENLRKSRPDLPMPPSTSLAAVTDPILERIAGPTESLFEPALEAQRVLKPTTDAEIERLNALSDALGLGSYLDRSQIDDAIRDRLDTFTGKTGIEERDIPAALAKLEADKASLPAGDKPLTFDASNAPYNIEGFTNFFARPDFFTALQPREVPGPKGTKKTVGWTPEQVRNEPFQSLYQYLVDQEAERAKNFKAALRGKHPAVTLDAEGKPGVLRKDLFDPEKERLEWQEIEYGPCLFMEGPALNHCLASEAHGHPERIRRGTEKAWGLRWSDENKPILTLSAVKENNNGVEVWRADQIKSTNNSMPYDVERHGDRAINPRLVLEADAMIDALGLERANSYGNWSEDVGLLEDIKRKVAQDPEYLNRNKDTGMWPGKKAAAAQTPAPQDAPRVDRPRVTQEDYDTTEYALNRLAVNNRWGANVGEIKNPPSGPYDIPALTAEKDISNDRLRIGEIDRDRPDKRKVVDPERIAELLGVPPQKVSTRVYEEIARHLRGVGPSKAYTEAAPTLGQRAEWRDAVAARLKEAKRQGLLGRSRRAPTFTEGENSAFRYLYGMDATEVQRRSIEDLVDDLQIETSSGRTAEGERSLSTKYVRLPDWLISSEVKARIGANPNNSNVRIAMDPESRTLWWVNYSIGQDRPEYLGNFPDATYRNGLWFVKPVEDEISEPMYELIEKALRYMLRGNRGWDWIQ